MWKPFGCGIYGAVRGAESALAASSSLVLIYVLNLERYSHLLWIMDHLYGQRASPTFHKVNNLIVTLITFPVTCYSNGHLQAAFAADGYISVR